MAFLDWIVDLKKLIRMNWKWSPIYKMNKQHSPFKYSILTLPGLFLPLAKPAEICQTNYDLLKNFPVEVNFYQFG